MRTQGTLEANCPQCKKTLHVVVGGVQSLACPYCGVSLNMHELTSQQPSWPKVIKRACGFLLLGLLLLGMGYFIFSGAAMGLLRKLAEPKDVEMKPFVSPDGKFKLSFPQEPKYFVLEQKTCAGTLKINDWEYKRPYVGPFFIASYVDAPPRGSIDRDLGFDGVAAELRRRGVWISSQVNMYYKGYKARKITGKFLLVHDGRVIVFFAGRRAFTLMAFGATEKERREFFESFEFVSPEEANASDKETVIETGEPNAVNPPSLEAEDAATPPIEPEEASASSEPPVATATVTDVGETSRIGDLIAQLRSADPSARMQALRQLPEEPANERKPEALRAVEALLSPQQEREMRMAALEALKGWADTSSIHALSRAAQDEDSSISGEAVSVLGSIASLPAYRTLADFLNDENLRMEASKALVEAGSDAEVAVLPCLRRGDAKARAEACRVLEEIGTSRSLPALRSLTNDSDYLIKNAAQRAYDQIVKRGNAKKAPASKPSPRQRYY